MKVFKSFLPVFSGFYETQFQYNREEDDIEYINEQREKFNLIGRAKFEDLRWDYNAHAIEVSKRCTSWMSNEMEKLGLVKLIRFEKLISPKEYNFETNSINVEIVMRNKEIKTLRDYIYANKEAFISYLKRYNSYDGFSSFFSSYFENWESVTDNFTNWETRRNHELGSALEFVCENEELTTNQMYEYSYSYEAGCPIKDYSKWVSIHTCCDCGKFIEDKESLEKIELYMKVTGNLPTSVRCKNCITIKKLV